MAACGHCGEPFEKTRDWSIFCSSSCRARSYRASHGHRGIVPGHSTETPTEAVALLHRLKGYTLPASRITAARKLAEGLRQVENDATAMLGALQALERDLTTLGAAYDEELAEIVELVERVFPGAQLVFSRSDAPAQTSTNA
jgi:hypothetical protein